MPDGADDRNVFELLRRRGGTQEHSTPAHVAPTDECRGKHEPLAEYGAQHLHVLIRRDAAEQHELRIGAGRIGQPAGGLLEGVRYPGLPRSISASANRLSTCDVMVVSAGSSP